MPGAPNYALSKTLQKTKTEALKKIESTYAILKLHINEFRIRF